MKKKTMAVLIVVVASLAVLIFARFADSMEEKPSASVSTQDLEFSGTGDTRTSKFSLEKGPAVFRMTHDGFRNSYFLVWLIDEEKDVETRLEEAQLLACVGKDEIGGFNGSKTVDIKKQGDNYVLIINADGRWTITIEQPRSPHAA